MDDRALLARAQTSAAGFGELFDAHYKRIYVYAYRRVGSREIAEDIAASVFEDALRDIKRLRWQDKPLVAWLYRIASRRVVDFYRARRDHIALDQIAARASDDNPNDAVTRADEFAAVRRGIARLSDRDREIIRLAYFDELSGEDLAAMLGCSANSAYVRLHRALAKLRKVLLDEA
ncbi:MAG: sigma-70 family RNA polymerase sigma factor [Chloroflexi bacterium]|nr:sigma-70 family RNA polymerase sigma factor [Chloroflexota bacterium]